MAKLRIITIGKLKNKSLKKECDELKKRIPRFEIVELKEISDKNVEVIQKKEEIALRPYITDSEYQTYLLWEHGKTQTTKQFSDILSRQEKNIQFIITGAFGPNESLKSKISDRLSLSPMTFTHEQALYMLVEQLYRHHCYKKGIQYNK